MKFSLFAIAALAAATSSSCIVSATAAAAAAAARKRKITKKVGSLSNSGSYGATELTDGNVIPIGESCEDPSTYNPTYTPQCINVGSGGYTCENVRIGGIAQYRCVAPPPTAAPTSDEGVSCVDPSTYNPTWTPQCINVGKGYYCENIRMGGVADYRCVPPPPTAAPTSQETIPCHTNHNPTTTPECPSGYTCQALMGANPNAYDGYCQEDIYD